MRRHYIKSQYLWAEKSRAYRKRYLEALDNLLGKAINDDRMVKDRESGKSASQTEAE